MAAICIDAPAARITLEEMVEHLTPHLLVTADRISSRLGTAGETSGANTDGGQIGNHPGRFRESAHR